MLSELYKTLEEASDQLPIPAFLPRPDNQPKMTNSERYTLSPDPYSTKLAVQNLATTRGFRIGRDPGMVTSAVATIRDDEEFQRGWNNPIIANWETIKFVRSLEHGIVLPGRAALSRFVLETLLRPVSGLLCNQKNIVFPSRRAMEPSKQYAPFTSRTPDPTFDRAIVCAFVNEIKDKLVDASPYVMGVVIDDFDYNSLVTLDGAKMTIDGHLEGKTSDHIPQRRTRHQRTPGFEATEALLLKVSVEDHLIITMKTDRKVCSIAVEYNLRYITIINWTGAVFLRVDNVKDDLTVGPFVPFKRLEPSSMSAKDAAIYRMAPPTPPTAPANLSYSVSSSTSAPSSPPSVDPSSSQSNYSLLLSLTAMAHVGYLEKEWMPNQNWAKLPSAPSRHAA